MYVDLTVGEKIKSRREGKKITQHELASALGISPAAVCQWERKGAVPRPKTLAKVAQALDVSEEYLAVPREPNIPTDPVSASEAIDKLKAIVANATGFDTSQVCIHIEIVG